MEASGAATPYIKVNVKEAEPYSIYCREVLFSTTHNGHRGIKGLLALHESVGKVQNANIGGVLSMSHV